MWEHLLNRVTWIPELVVFAEVWQNLKDKHTKQGGEMTDCLCMFLCKPLDIFFNHFNSGTEV